MPKGPPPIVHAESEYATRTPDALEAMLAAWVHATLEPLSGTLHYEQGSSALWRYLTAKMQFATQPGVHHAVAYHRTAMEAAPARLRCTTPSHRARSLSTSACCTPVSHRQGRLRAQQSTFWQARAADRDGLLL